MEDKSVIELTEVTSNFVIKDNNSPSESSTSNPNPVFFYDKYSKKIMEVSLKSIKVYNKKAKNLKANLNLFLPIDSIITLSIDKNLNYILCLLMNQQGEHQISKCKLLLLNANKGVAIDSIKDNFSFLLGMFFIGKIISLTNPEANNNDDMHDFCLIYCDKIVFYGIEISSNEEKIKKISFIEMTNNTLIKDFSYNYKNKILCLVKTDLTIIFLNLSNRKFYNQCFTPNLPFIKPLKEKSNLGQIRKVSDEHKKQIKNIFETSDKYTETQFYLETIYDSLYLICLCYEDNCIYINELENLNSLKKRYCIEYKNHMRYSGLLITDNLILVHNFMLQFFVIIDIKSKVCIINQNNCKNFPKFKNLFLNGEILEERRLPSSKNKKINLFGGTLYNLNFNAEKYFYISMEKIKSDKTKKLNGIKENKNKKVLLNQYDIFVNLLRRKGTKDIILNNLYKIILNNETKTNYIINFFIAIIEKICNAMPKNIIPDKKTIKKEISESNVAVNLPKTSDIIITKKNYIKQIDIWINLFEKLEKEIENNNITNINDKIISQVIFYMIQFSLELDARKIIVQPCFNRILLFYIKQLKNKEKILYYFLNYDNINGYEIGEYFLELSKNKQDKNWIKFECLGINILKRSKKYEKVIDFFFENNNISQAMNYLIEISNDIKESQLVSIINKYKEKIEKNKNSILEYLR